MRSARPVASSPPPLYRPELEHDSCGVGLAVDIDGRRSRDLLDRSLLALARLAHRGGAIPDLVDGAGVMTDIPWRVFAADFPRERGRGASRALGMFFLAPEEADGLRTIIERRLHHHGWVVHAWRRVPVDSDVLGATARAIEPQAWQAVASSALPRATARRQLYMGRLSIERALRRERLTGTVVSLSTRTVVYKGLLAPAHLAAYYRDLQDPRFETASVLFHQRFSTNTNGDWRLAQPFRLLAHNGEINTICANRIWMRARQRDAACLPGYSKDRVVGSDGSDSQSLDEAVELLRSEGFDLAHALSRFVPPAWEQDEEMPRPVSAFYEYQASASEPWDGPAAIVFCDGNIAGAMMDRNGFRPLRYSRTRHQVFAGSEAGIFDLAGEDVVEHGRLGPGDMLVVDLKRKLVRDTAAIRQRLARRRPYRQWLERTVVPVAQRPDGIGFEAPPDDDASRQRLFGYTREELDVILRVMAVEQREAVGSMGDDAPLAVLSERNRLLPDYFRQRFAQVTNPPMDPLREGQAMSLRTLIGPRGRFQNERARASQLAIQSPILTRATLDVLANQTTVRSAQLPLVFAAESGAAGLDAAIASLVDRARQEVRGGAGLLILSDADADADHAPIPPLLAVSAIHHGLIDAGLRMRASLVVDTDEARDAHQIAALLAFGAAAVCPSLGYRSASALAAANGFSASTGMERYRLALELGLLKILSKAGVCTIASYCGGQLFEALGLGRRLARRFFPGVPSALGGIELPDVAEQVLERHRRAFVDEPVVLEHPGFHGYRRNGEYHANNPAVIRALHKAMRSADVVDFRAFAGLVDDRPATAIRDLLDVVESASPAPLAEVEPVGEICRRFFASAMSVGALSPEAHAAVALAMNRMGARSNSGEGGEESDRRTAQGEWAGSATKQVASARFGVTPAYLVSATELQIKIAQGSKPGEGGQLPGIKVDGHIAALRHALPGTTLISPPVHHDIYSIEDLAQLIYDLRALHPAARINVKLVAQTGIGIVAAGVVKAGADAIQVSGHDGGTGASPRASIKHAGMPWELGLAEVQQVLVWRGLRDRVVLQVDGGLKTARDVIVAAALGADEYGFATAALTALGCVMARQCHLNTCPVGIASQRPDLRARFSGSPDTLVAFFRMLAGEIRELVARLGLRRLDDVVGRVDLLRPRPPRSSSETRLDLAPILYRPDPAAGDGGKGAAEASGTSGRPPLRVGPDFESGLLDAIGPDHPLELAGIVRNTDRALGARMAGVIAARYGERGLPPGSVRISLTGAAGQSFGAFCSPGMELRLTGEANDYVAKGMSGGKIVIVPPRGREGRSDVLAGNTVLYGATGGRLFIAGRAGERFAVRNSGALAVVEGVGDHGCEYMTAGVVLVLGPTGRNFAAGMAGGRAFVYDPEGRFPARCSAELVSVARLDTSDVYLVTELLEEHSLVTSSPIARSILRGGLSRLGAFWKVAAVSSAAVTLAHAPIADEESEPVEVAVPVAARR